MSEEKLVPKLRFSGFNDEWKSYKIGDISKTYSGGTPSTSKREYYEGDIPFIKSGEINNDVTEQYITEDAINNSSAKRVQKGDLLLALYGATSGEVAISKINGAINQAVLKIDNDMDNYFQYNYFLKYKEQITHKYLQGGQGNLSANIIKKLEFKFPKFNEQQKISQFLLLIDKKIEFLEKKHNVYQDFKKYLMQQIFAQKLRFNFTDKWKVVKLETLIKKGKAGGTPSSTNSDYYNGDIPFLSIKDMTEQGKYIVKTEKSITNEGLNNSSAWIIPKYSLLYSIYASIGLVAINRTEISTSQAIYGIILKNGVSLQYMYYYLIYFKKNVHRYIETGTQGNLNAKLLKSFEVLLPSLKEQEMIVNILSLADEKIENTEKEIIKMKEFKNGLLQQMFV